jgi:hypothetical protein
MRTRKPRSGPGCASPVACSRTWRSTPARELAIPRVGQLAAEYEWVQHVPVTLSVGVSREQIEALDRGDSAR